MAKVKNQTWVTSITKEDQVISALVLARSIRRTETTRMLTAITVASELSKDSRDSLRDLYDFVFFMDEELFPERNKIPLKEKAKLYALALRTFEKCVYLDSSTILLENADNLFDDTCPEYLKDGEIEPEGEAASTFMCLPSMEGFNMMVAAAIKTPGSKMTLQMSTNYIKPVSENYQIELDIDKGYIVRMSKAHVPIVRITSKIGGNGLVENINALTRQKDIRIVEKIILRQWLDLYHGSSPHLYTSPVENGWTRGGNSEMYDNEPIAIIGMSCRLPEANNLDEFWKLLYEGREGIRPPPAYRWVKEHSIRVSPESRNVCAGFLSCPIDEFDARFFGISPKDAAFMDPQSRLLHEVFWEGLENSGINPLSLHGSRTAIFTGSWMNDYEDLVQLSPQYDFFRCYMGNSNGATAAKLSFLLGLVGPSITTESACSSSMAAIDLAIKSLRKGETNLALAGGVNLLLHPFHSDILPHVIAPDGRCKTFDSKADGYGRAEGCAVLVLKRLSDALRDRDNIWATIRGSALAQEGVSRSMGTPTVHVEKLAIELALKDAKVQPEEVSYVEFHGTGTIVGDFIEVSAVQQAYHAPKREKPLLIGSCKVNVGHSESCSGITGIIKTVLALQHEFVPKHRNMEKISPEIDLSIIPAIIPTESTPWPKVSGTRRIAGVSSYGITGTDGHMIIEEAPGTTLPKFTLGMDRPMHLMNVSAKSAEALAQLLKDYQDIFERNESAFEDIAYSANTGRAGFPHRAVIIAEDSRSAIKCIEDKSYLQRDVYGGGDRKLCFLFTGQGSQYPGMAQSLYETNPVFRAHFDICDRILLHLYNISISNVLWSSTTNADQLNRSIYSQTSIFCVEYCLLKVWESWGIKPDFVMGHSLGEFCAAVAAGILHFEDAIKMVAERSRLIDSLPRGRMLVVKADKLTVQTQLLKAQISLDLAAVNSPDQTVVAGDSDKIEEFAEHLKGNGLKCIALGSSHAFHSIHMDPILEEYKNIVKTVRFNKQGKKSVSYVSGVEGRLITDKSEICNPDYWVRHTREKVNFVEACHAIVGADCVQYLELGPQPVLSSFIYMNSEDVHVTCFPSLRKGSNEWSTILNSLAQIYLGGNQVNWEGFDEPYMRKKVSLPYHPFYRKPYWIESHKAAPMPIHPLLGSVVSNASDVSIFQNDLTLKAEGYLRDHCIGTRIIVPAACYTEMMLMAGYCVVNCLSETLETPRRPLRVEDFKIDAPLELKEENCARMQCTVASGNGTSAANGSKDGFECKVFHQSDAENDGGPGKWILHASSKFVTSFSRKEALEKWNPARIREIQNSQVANIPNEGLYKRADAGGLKFGENLRTILQHWNVSLKNKGYDEVVSEMAMPERVDKHIVHPLILDAMFQTVVCSKMNHEKNAAIAIPIAFERLTTFIGGKDIQDAVEGNLYIHLWLENGKPSLFVGGMNGETGVPIACLEGVEIIDTNVKTIESVLEQQTRGVPDSWEQVWKPLLGTGPGNSVSLQALDSFKIIEPQTDVCYVNTDRIVYLYCIKALLSFEWSPAGMETFTASDVCSKYTILEKYTKLIHFYLETVAKEMDGLYWSQEGQQWACKPDFSLPKMKEIDNELELIRRNNTDSATLSFLQTISENLLGILTGNSSYMTTFFPENKNGKTTYPDFCSNHHGYVAAQESTKSLIMQAIERLHESEGDSRSRRLRVLEIGNGSLEMTKEILEHLRHVCGENFEFTYTEKGSELIDEAKRALTEYQETTKFMKFCCQESPLQQGIPLYYFDLVVAFPSITNQDNSLATSGHLKLLLNQNGVYCGIEKGNPMPGELKFAQGLMESFWELESLPKIDTQSYLFKQTTSGFASILLEESQLQLQCVDREPAGKWIIFASDLNSYVSKTKSTLEACGYNVITVEKPLEGDSREEDKDGTGIASILKANEKSLIGVIYGWGLDLSEFDQNKISLPFLHITQTIMNMRKPPQLYVVTQALNDITDDIVLNPTSATLLGMAKSLKNESPELHIKCIDLDGRNCNHEQMANEVLYEVAMIMRSTNPHDENVQIAYRNGARFEPRFVRTALPLQAEELQLPPGSDRFHLRHPETRLINDLSVEAVDAEDLAEEMVEIKVKSYALNMKDVFTIVKPIEEFERLHALGLDASGVVTRVGAGVTRWKVGDRVFGINGSYQMSSYIYVPQKGLSSVPTGMSHWEASTLPLVFSTALLGLVNVARVRATDTVLVHTGAGGVGLSAIKIARFLGATVITTAGSERKRRYLKELGFEHVFHSRNTSYEQEIARVTNGKGVTVVLNTLTGPGFKEATLRSCAKGARFVEISKIDVWTPEEVQDMRSDVKYDVIDITDLTQEEWAHLNDKMQTTTVFEHEPYFKFDLLNVRQGLYYFQKAKHIGKLICVMPQISYKNGQTRVLIPLFNDESMYLITGGLGGIGFEVCKWMLEKGATSIVLVGRSPPKPELQRKIDELNQDGNHIEVLLGDVGDAEQCKGIIDKIEQNHSSKTLRGVMHCAGVIRDKLYGDQTWDSFSETFQSKVSGTWNLHNLTKHLPLEHFVLYSSLTALIGTPSQANYAAANCFEDAFAHYRWGMGLPSTVVNWGQWAQVGLAKELNLTGVLPVSVTRMLNGLERLLKTPKIQACLSEFESFSNLSLLCPALKPYLDSRLWGQVKETRDVTQGMSAEEFWTEMNGCSESKQKIAVVSTYLKRTLRNALRIDASEPISDDQNIRDLGADSLMFMELKNSIQTLMAGKLQVTAALLKDRNTVRELATALVEKLEEGETEEKMSVEELIDLLEKDSRLEDDIETEVKQDTSSATPTTVFLTGVTGRLGPHILSKLCEVEISPNVQKVICLIRTADGESAQEKLEKTLESANLTDKVDMSKVTCLQGNVASKQFGLEKEAFENLVAEVDAIVHCAVKSDHTEPYRLVKPNSTGEEPLSDVRSVNVEGTKNILKLACQGKPKQVYYASIFSSIFGGGEAQEKNQGYLMSDDWPLGSDLKLLAENGAPGYPISKTVCEILIEQAIQRGIPCKVFRFPWISGSGQIDYSNNHYILRFLSYMKLKAMPDIVIPANVLPANVCAELSTKVFMTTNASNEVYNVCHPNPSIEQDFVEACKENFSISIEIVPFKKWAEMLQESDSPLGSLKVLYKDMEKTIESYSSTGSSYFTNPGEFFKNDKLEKLIPGFSKSLPASMEIVMKDLIHLKEKGIFEKLGLVV